MRVQIKVTIRSEGNTEDVDTVEVSCPQMGFEGYSNLKEAGTLLKEIVEEFKDLKEGNII